MTILADVATRRGPDPTNRRTIMRLGRFIVEHRKKAGLSQSALGARLGLTQGAVSEWERGVSPPEWTLWAPLCHQLDVSMVDFLSVIWDLGEGQVRDPTIEDLAREILARTQTNDADGSDVDDAGEE